MTVAGRPDMIRSSLVSLSVLAVTAALVAACGGGPDSTFDPTADGDQGGAGAGGGGSGPKHAGEATAIVLVTDGEPNDCNSDVGNVSQAAAGVASKIPTYVIGVGSDTVNLDTIAQGGGTQKAIIVDASNGAQANAQFMQALQ